MPSLKRKNPYTILKDTMREYADKVDFPHRVLMWTYSIYETYNLGNLRERTIAAHQLGYEVRVQAALKNDTIEVYYVKQRPHRPWEINE